MLPHRQGASPVQPSILGMPSVAQVPRTAAQGLPGVALPPVVPGFLPLREAHQVPLAS